MRLITIPKYTNSGAGQGPGLTVSLAPGGWGGGAGSEGGSDAGG